MAQGHKDANREWMYGYLAEDLEEMGFEHVLHYNKDGEPQAVDYGLISTLVLELVKEQHSEIELLKEKIKRLEEK